MFPTYAVHKDMAVNILTCRTGLLRTRTQMECLLQAGNSIPRWCQTPSHSTAWCGVCEQFSVGRQKGITGSRELACAANSI